MKTVIEKENGFWILGIQYENQTFYLNFRSKRKSELNQYAKMLKLMIDKYKCDLQIECINRMTNKIKRV